MNHSCVRLAEPQGSAEHRVTQGAAHVPVRRAPRECPCHPAPPPCQGEGNHLLKRLQVGAAGREGRELWHGGGCAQKVPGAVCPTNPSCRREQRGGEQAGAKGGLASPPG